MCKGKNWVKKAFSSILKWKAYIKTEIAEYFTSGPMVKNPPCNAGHRARYLVRELRYRMSQGN